MKIAALSPQFVFETPAGEEKTAAEKAAAELQLRLVRVSESEGAPPGASSTSNKKALDEEARAGLRRLSKLIRGQRKTAGSATDQESSDQRKRRALISYQKMSAGGDPRDALGRQIDKVV